MLLLLVPRVKRNFDEVLEKNIDYLCFFEVGYDGMSSLVEFHQELDKDDSRNNNKDNCSHSSIFKMVTFVNF